MVMSIIAAIIAAFMIFIPSSEGNHLSNIVAVTIMLSLSSVFLVIATVILTMAWAPLQKVEQNLTPRLIEFFQGDRLIGYTTLWIYAFPLLSILLATSAMHFEFGRTIFWLALWTLLLGTTIDATIFLIHRTTSYLNPFSIVTHISDQTIAAINSTDDVNILSWIDSLSEISIKAVHQTLPSLSIQSIDSLQQIFKKYLIATKNSSTSYDLVSYTLFYLYDRLEYLNDKALGERMEPVCNKLITTMGKFAIYAAKYDISLASYPLHFLGRFAKKAHEKNIESVTEKATCTLLEVGKILIHDIDLQYLDIKEAYFCINLHMEEIAKANFKKDKTINIPILTQPFHDLKKIFSNEKIASHIDTPIIIKDIERIIDQFEQLELVMKKIPSVEIAETEDE